MAELAGKTAPCGGGSGCSLGLAFWSSASAVVFAYSTFFEGAEGDGTASPLYTKR